ncbi:Zinc finger and SCAN domain-containing protein 2 [Schistosoma japonicum]|nr:Zinc finger and SCAN domain-containing protein 2 [Schistosoma japonicum]
MSDQMVDPNEPSAYIANADGTYTAIPFSQTEDGQVVLQLNEMGLSNEGEEMVLIAADDTATLESLIASGAVTAIAAENGTEYLQFTDPGMEGAQVIELPADQMHLWDPNSKAYYDASECLGCAVTFDSIYNLNKHTRSCRIVRTLQTKFRCLPCNAYVSDVASLKAHVKAHEGSQIISCPVCGERGFPGFNQLNHHITRAHALKVNRRHVCRYCESTFEIKKDLDMHIRSMHAEERNARQSRGAVGRLKCRYNHCEFTTNSIMLLDRHHDQHRRQEEDGEDVGLELPPARGTATGGVVGETNATSRRMSRARRLPAWYKDYDTDFVVHEEGVIDREEVQAQLPPGIELEDPSDMDKEDVPTEEWNIVVYDDDDEDEDEDSPIDYEDEDGNVMNDGSTTCDTTGLLNVHTFS